MLAMQADATASGYGYTTVLSMGSAQSLPLMRSAMSVHPYIDACSSYLSVATTLLVELRKLTELAVLKRIQHETPLKAFISQVFSSALCPFLYLFLHRALLCHVSHNSKQQQRS